MSQVIDAQHHEGPLRECLQSGGASRVIEYLHSFDPAERRHLYQQAQRRFGRGDSACSLDDYIAVIDAGIENFVHQAQATEDRATADDWKNFANVLSYNLAADLAECWPEDPRPRRRQHFERGLRAAADCLRWRAELNKPPFPFAIAWWAKGMHLMSLRRWPEAVAAFESALEYGKRAVPEGTPTTVTADGAFIVIVNSGYLGLAQWAAGNRAGKSRYEQAIAAFATLQARVLDEETKEEADLGRSQLQCVAERFRLVAREDTGAGARSQSES